MKFIEESENKNASNALGRLCYVKYTIFEVEQSDVGVTRHNYRGYKYSEYTFKKSDVGKQISVITDDTPSYTCWNF